MNARGGFRSRNTWLNLPRPKKRGLDLYAFGDLYGAWKIEKKTALQKVQSPFFPNALGSQAGEACETQANQRDERRITMQAQPSGTRKKRSTSSAGRREHAGEVEAVQIAANSYCLAHYGVRVSGGMPRRLALRKVEVWIVPAYLTSPGYGVVGEVGVVAIDAGTREVIGATPSDEVQAAAARLKREKRDEVDAAFHRTRKT